MTKSQPCSVVGLVWFVSQIKRAETGPIKDWEERAKQTSELDISARARASIHLRIHLFRNRRQHQYPADGSGLSIEQAEIPS